MAIIRCPECNNNVSDTARTCPHCGYKLKEEAPIVEAAKDYYVTIYAILAIIPIIIFMLAPIILGAVLASVRVTLWPIVLLGIVTIPLGVFFLIKIFLKRDKTQEQKTDNSPIKKGDTVVLLQDVMSTDRSTRIKAGLSGTVTVNGSYMITVQFKIGEKTVNVQDAPQKFKKQSNQYSISKSNKIAEGDEIVFTKDVVISDIDKRVIKEGTIGKIIMIAGDSYYISVVLEGSNVKTRQLSSSFKKR